MLLITENNKGARLSILMNLLSELGFKSIKDFQKSKKLEPDSKFGIMSYNSLYLQLLKVVDINFKGFYFEVPQTKNQIVWHHSAGWDNARGMFDWWKNDGIVHVSTAIGITDDGTICRGYEEIFWSHHIGMKHVNNLIRNQQSIAVEICNWGNLTEKKGKLYSWANVEIPKEKAIELNYKGSKYYETYTDQEIKALKYWTLLNAMRFDIPIDYNEHDMWQVSKDAINGKAGLFTHNSFLDYKTDVSPQPKLIQMAQSLKDYTK